MHCIVFFLPQFTTNSINPIEFLSNFLKMFNNYVLSIISTFLILLTFSMFHQLTSILEQLSI